MLTAFTQHPVQGSGHRCEEDIVDRGAVRVRRPLHRREVGTRHRETAVRSDRLVQ
jgi:hypothetical protein